MTGHRPRGAIYTKGPEIAHPWRQERMRGCRGWGQGGWVTAKGCRASVQGDENVVKVTVVTGDNSVITLKTTEPHAVHGESWGSQLSPGLWPSGGCSINV